MADGENGVAGNKGKQRRDSQKRGRKVKNAKQPSSKGDELTCHMCSEIFVDASDKLLECERCDLWFCTKCIDMNDAIYKIMVERKDMHWYCNECETLAVTAVKTDKDIEDKCAAYMKTLTERLDKMDEKIADKADRHSVVELENRVKNLEGKQDNDPSGEDRQHADTVRETIEEQKEREFRLKNIIIHNLPESEKDEIEDRKEDDIALVTSMFNALNVSEENVIEKCSRIGKKENGKVRITKVVLKNVELKRKILKKSRSLKSFDDFKNVFVGPDLTVMQRKEQYLLRKELGERKRKGEKDIFISRGKIVHARDRAVQFRGGATGDGSSKQ